MMIVAGGYLISRVLGLLREIIITAQFGTTPALDAYRAAFGVLDIIYLVVAGGALGSAFITVLAGHLGDHRTNDARRLTHALVALTLLALLAAAALAFVLADPLVRLIVAPGFDAAQQQRTAEILRLLLLQPILLGIGGLAKATLETFERFSIPALAANLYNLGIIGGALLAPWLGINGLVIGVNAGALLFVLVQLPALGRTRMLAGKMSGPRAWLAAPGLRTVLVQIGPRLFGQSIWGFNLLAIIAFASRLGPGAVSANALAYQLLLLPHGLIALSAGTVIFPQLARHAAAGDTEALRAGALRTLRGVLFLGLPAAMGLLLLALPILRALFQRGAFDASSAALTTQALLGYAPALAGFAAAEIIVRTFYAMRDTWTPVVVGVITVLLNLLFINLVIAAGWGVGGLGLAFSASSTIEALLLLGLLLRRLPGELASFWRMIGRSTIATLLMGGVLTALVGGLRRVDDAFLPGDTYVWPAEFPALVLWLTIVGAVGAAVYIGAALLLQIPEAATLRDQVLARLDRRTAKAG